jgi:hypothetical protein
MMRHDTLKQLYAALRQAALSLKNLKMTRSEEDPEVTRLIAELQAAIPRSNS